MSLYESARRRPVRVAGLMAAAIAGIVAAVAGQPTDRPQPPTVDVRLAQRFSFEEAIFRVTISTPGVRFKDEPRVRPFYGKATPIPDSLTNTTFAFRWDVPGAIRAARNRLRSTKIYLHWTMAPDGDRDVVETDLLTVISVSLSSTGMVAVAEVDTSAPSTGPWTPRGAATRPAPPVTEAGPIRSAVSHLSVDDIGVVHLQIWVTGGAMLVSDPTAMANIGHARVRRVAGSPNRIDVEWSRSAREKRAVVPVSLVVTWGCTDATETFYGGRSVLELIATKSEVGVRDIRTTTRQIPRPATPSTRPTG